MKYANGDIFVGNYKDNERNGYGQFYNCKKQTLYNGKWENDIKKGPGVMKYPEGKVIEGTGQDDVWY